MNVLVSGDSGFLLRNTLPDYAEWNIISYEHGKSYNNIDMVVHFASPSDRYDFKDKTRMARSMVELTLDLVYEAKYNSSKFIFASSMGAKFLEDEYSIYKRAMEQYISHVLSDYLILRIPRVYDKNRNKGLMYRIRNDEIEQSDWDNKIQYITLDDFRVWFKNSLTKSGIQYYDEPYRVNTIKELKELFCES